MLGVKIKKELIKSLNTPASLSQFQLFLPPLEGNAIFMDSSNTWCIARSGQALLSLSSKTRLTGPADLVVQTARWSSPVPLASYQPNTLLSHASFAFDSYYQQNGNSDIECSTLTYGHSNHHRAREIQVNATMSKCTCVFFLSNHVIRTRIRALKPLGIGPTRTLHSGYSTLAPLGNRTQHSLAQTLENFAHSSNRELCCSVFGLPSSG